MYRFLTRRPGGQEPDLMWCLISLTVISCVVKFFFEGVSFELFGHMISLGHADAMSYGALLTPILGAHATREWKQPTTKKGTGVVDDPDQV